MDFTLIIILTLVGFAVLAYLLLMPVYRFLQREEQASERWTHEELRRRQRAQEAPSGDGAGGAQSGEAADETVR